MLEVTVFICGAAVMIIELAGSRILAPYLGTSLVIWTALIGIIMASLALGYWRGGVAADRKPDPGRLGWIILGAAGFTATIAGSKAILLIALQNSLNLHGAAILSSMLLFAPPAFLLGMVAPYAVRLKMTDTASSGRTAGNLYALSTLGSIAGTFAGGFFLISYLGSTNIMLLTAALLALASRLAHRGGSSLKIAMTVLFLVGFGLARGFDASLAEVGVHDVDTPYNRVLIYNSRDDDSGRLTRELITGPGGRQSAMYMDDPAALALTYTRFYRLLELYRPGAQNLLMLGGGGYSFPKYALANYPDLRMDVVEIDPDMTDLSGRLFGLRPDPRLTVHHEDARTYLNRCRETYDVVCVDVFNSSYSIPFHVATVEAVRAVRDRLKPDGVVLVNILSPLEGRRGRVFRSILAAYAEVFPQVWVYRSGRSTGTPPEELQNIMLVAVNGKTPMDRTSADPELSFLLSRRLEPTPAADVPAMTDDFAPIDRYLSGLW